MVAWLCLPLLVACNFSRKEDQPVRPVTRAFYYWKSVFTITAFEQQRLDSLQVNLVYLKFFDVDWNEVTRQAVPVAKLRVPDTSSLRTLEVVPTIFITNACFEQLAMEDVNGLAQKIHSLLSSMLHLNGIPPVNEIQVDCDWTAGTREKYFDFLHHFKSVSNCTVSATIRLHQVKYPERSGIPPADKGLLMCYNMGNLKSSGTTNSIIETKELKKYTGRLRNYPLPLDVGLPLFDWMVLYRQQLYKGLIDHLPAADFTNTFSVRNGNTIRLLKDTLVKGYAFKQGDVLRYEQSEIDEVISAAREINKQLKNSPRTISLYHLDAVTLKKYTIHELESIYSIFH